MTVVIHQPRTTVRLPAPVLAPAPARLVEALALAADIRAAGAYAFRVHGADSRG